MYKQDFTNVLDIEIDSLEKLLSSIHNEVNARKANPPSNPIEKAVNEKRIIELECDIRAKKEFLEKLKLKKLEDESELDSDYEDLLTKYEDLFEQAEDIEDPQGRNYAELHMAEFKLWKERGSKEACVFYFNCLKRLLEERK